MKTLQNRIEKHTNNSRLPVMLVYRKRSRIGVMRALAAVYKAECE